MRRAEDAQISLINVWPAQQIAVLPTEVAASRLDDSLAKFMAVQVAMFPLHFACQLRRRAGTKSGFVQEYIAPQLLLRWILDRPDSGIRGVAYQSSRADRISPQLKWNYVIPALEIRNRGICMRLREDFPMTQPVNWSVAESVRHALDIEIMEHQNIEVGGVGMPYAATTFGQVEAFLNAQTPGPVECALTDEWASNSHDFRYGVDPE